MTKRRGNKEGAIWKERKKWRAAVTIDGKRLTRSFSTKDECRAWIRDTQDQIQKGMTYKMSGVTLGEYIQPWIELHKTRLSPKTAVRYKQIIRDYIVPQLGSIKLRDLRLEQIEAHCYDLLKKGLSPRSARFPHMIIQRSLDDAVRKGYVSYNAAHGATLPRSSQKEMEILDEDEVMRFMITIQDTRYEALYHLAIKTGMRKGEILGLKWSDLDWKRGTLRIQRQVYRVHKQGLVIRQPKTRASRRTIQLGEKMLDVLRVHHSKQQILKAAAGKRWKEKNLIFTSTIGTHLGGSNLRNDYNNQLIKANIRHIRFHDLRHTAASLMLNNGVPIIVVSKMLGHSKTSTTLDIYGHLMPTMQDEAARIMDELVTPIKLEMGNRVDSEQKI